MRNIDPHGAGTGQDGRLLDIHQRILHEFQGLQRDMQAWMFIVIAAEVFSRLRDANYLIFPNTTGLVAQYADSCGPLMLPSTSTRASGSAGGRTAEVQ
jgi:hypothetical protein